jgi:hypothetical protein
MIADRLNREKLDTAYPLIRKQYYRIIMSSLKGWPEMTFKYSIFRFFAAVLLGVSSYLVSIANAQWQNCGVSVHQVPGVMSIAGRDGWIVLAWSDDRSGDQNVYIQRLDELGNPVYQEGGLLVCDEADHQNLQAMVLDGHGGGDRGVGGRQVPAACDGGLFGRCKSQNGSSNHNFRVYRYLCSADRQLGQYPVDRKRSSGLHRTGISGGSFDIGRWQRRSIFRLAG